MRPKDRETSANGTDTPVSRQRHPQRKVFLVVVVALVILTIGIVFVLPKFSRDKVKDIIPALPLVPGEVLESSLKETSADAQYLFPKSDRVLLTDADIKDCDHDTLKLGRNEIFARHGYIFQTTEIAEYFETKPWYRGTTPGERFDSNLLNGIELQNINFLSAAQKNLEYKANAHVLADKITAVQKDFTIPEKDADSSALVRAFLAEDKPMLLAFRLVDLDKDGVPALFLAYLTNANGPSKDNIQSFSGWWEVWAIEKNDFVCVQKEQFGVSAAGGGDGLTVGIYDADAGKSDKLLNHYISTQDVTEHVYTFVAENGSKDRYQIYEYWGEDAREPDGTRNGGKLMDAAKQLKRCAAMQEEIKPLFSVGFNTVSDWTNVIQINEDIAKNIEDASAAVQTVNEKSA